jgi:hypothetical protein
VEGRFSPFGARFGPNILEARKLFWTDRMVLLRDMANGGSLETLFVSVLLGDKAKVEARFSSYVDNAKLDAR